jgi:hydrogenase/urease accessory protein HupE
MMLRLLVLLQMLIGAAGPAAPHALQPGFLNLEALGDDAWQVFWKVPTDGTGPMAITAVLPEHCLPRQPEGQRFDGSAFVSAWVAVCPGGLEGGEVKIEGLALTATDVLVRYELEAGRTNSQRLTAATPGFTVPAPQGRLGVVATYFALGVDHILRGIDHLMFVFALILLVRDRGMLVAAVTAFTVAHSLSLAAAALGWIVVPAPPVEAVVALSIMFLAAELVRPAGAAPSLSARFPWLVAFTVGLLHGLGFARALLDVGLPEGEVPLALLAFNLGVEAGQLLFIALVLVVGALLARLYPHLVRSMTRPGGRGLGVTSYLMGGIAAAWLVARVAAF